MLGAKTVEQLQQALVDRAIKFKKEDNKKTLSEKLWANRDKANIK